MPCFTLLRSRAFLSLLLRVNFAMSGWRRHKKGGDNDLKKLRNGAKRNEAILTFFLLWRKGKKCPSPPARVGGA
jgi:hypothetical protein